MSPLSPSLVFSSEVPSGLMVGGHGFAIHRGVTLSGGWLCQKWNPLDILATHLHYVMQLLNEVYLTQLKTRSTGVVSSHWFSSSVVSLACITSVRSIHCFPGGHSLHLAFGSFFYNHPLSRPLYFPLINQYDRCLVPLVRGLMAGGHRFASHRGTALSRGWLCQKGKFLDTPGTHLH